MWVFLPFGFFSVVRPAGGPADELCVRTRFKEDFDRLQKFIEGRKMPYRLYVAHTPGTDFPWRAFVWKRTWSDILDAATLETAYPDFEDQCTEVLGTGRAEQVRQVGAVMARTDAAQKRWNLVH